MNLSFEVVRPITDLNVDASEGAQALPPSDCCLLPTLFRDGKSQECEFLLVDLTFLFI